MENANFNNTLVGRRVRIHLEHFDKEVLEKLRKRIPEMPTIEGTLIKRYLFSNWGYIVKLDEPLLLDREGVDPEVKNRISTYYLCAHISNVKQFQLKDPLYLELTGKTSLLQKCNSVSEDGEVHIMLDYIENPDVVPSEILKSDNFLKISPYICDGWIKLID